MTVERLQDTKPAIDRWDEVFEALSAEPRRQLLVTLMDSPDGRRVPLPDAAVDPSESAECEELRLHLTHRHLPMLAELGFVDWTTDPFCAQRGTRFGEVAAVVELLYANAHALPDQLVDGYRRLEQERDD
ncbi:hypothetical protein [Natrarchaeobius chitinivorans]|uniref:ArsR family transcriptional regulator n=1 Tax=Natrarchaeobius chitinivorans TaxID=1679083 RepID=A0A3N6P5L8_NATCH|nr:hypothetical protein [Natrarchaeobius chitinivorans]RQG93449.1 hypothetical protein EA473_15610 [Natrarchaeobius chitinivorans]